MADAHRPHKVFDTLGSRPTEAMLAREYSCARSPPLRSRHPATRQYRLLPGWCECGAILEKAIL